MTIPDLSLTIHSFEPFDEDTEKSNGEYWNQEIKSWKNTQKQSWPVIDHKVEIDSVIGIIVSDFISYINEAYDHRNQNKLGGLQFTQEFYWKFSASDFCQESHSSIISFSGTEDKLDLQFPDEMPASVFNVLSARKQKAIAKVYLAEVCTSMLAQWQEESQYLPVGSSYPLSVEQESMGEWRGKKAQISKVLTGFFTCNGGAETGDVEGYYRMRVVVST
jgi:hypothetical protein